MHVRYVEGTNDTIEKILKKEGTLSTMRGKVTMKLKNKKSDTNDSTLQEPLARKSEVSGNESLNVIVLDSAQTKFSVKSNPEWTVAEFKQAGSVIHKVAPASQRLIYMGKLLQDSQLLKDYGIDGDEKIVHLFPKPQVVINSTASDEAGEERPSSPSSENGAHVPQIVVDADEAGNRSQLMILSSHEIFEAQHRIKLLSFFLFVICAMQLLTLFTLLAGVPPSPEDGNGNQNGFSGGNIPPGDPTDSFNHQGSNDPTKIRTWQNSYYFDLLICSLGLYVSTLGIKAATENTVPLAKQYFSLLLVTGISWLVYNYYFRVCEEREEAHLDQKDVPNSYIYSQALIGLSLPTCVWLFCFFRAFQFTRLLEDAQQEAEERIGNMNPSNSDEEMPESNDGLNDLQLRLENRTIT